MSRVLDSGGAPQALSRPGDTGDASHRWPQILPGGRAVLFSGSPTVAGDWDNAAIYVLSLKTGQVKVVERGGYFARYAPTSSRSGTLAYIHQGTLFGVQRREDARQRSARCCARADVLYRGTRAGFVHSLSLRAQAFAASNPGLCSRLRKACGVPAAVPYGTAARRARIAAVGTVATFSVASSEGPPSFVPAIC